MTKTLYEAAALTAAIAPGFSPSGVRESEQFMEAGDRDGLQTVVVLDAAGKEFDTTIAQGADAVRLLSRRAVSAIRLREAKEPATLRFRMDNVRYFKTLNKKDGPEALAVMVTKHHDGEAAILTDLTEAQCGALGAAIGAVHRLNPQFFRKAKFPSFTADQIERQLRAWVKSLTRNDQIPQQILSAWNSALQEPGLFNFRSRVVHGGFKDGDALFQQNDVSALLHWEDLQINDPARDLAWIYMYLDQPRREAVTAAYARVMGSRMDDMIMLRARMWVQMEQVRDFLTAVERADNVEIMDLKARLDHMAHAIVAEHGSQPGSSRHFEHPSTVTVGDLLAHPDLKTDAQPQRGAQAGDATAGSANDASLNGTEPYTVNAADYERAQAGTRTGTGVQATGTQSASRSASRKLTRTKPLPQGSDSATQAFATPAPGEQLQHFSLPELNTVGLDLEELSHASNTTWAHDDGATGEATGIARNADDGATVGAGTSQTDANQTGDTAQTDDTHSMATVTESALSMSFIPRRTRTGLRPIVQPASGDAHGSDVHGDTTNTRMTGARVEQDPESSPTQIYAEAMHADEIGEFSDEFHPAVRYGTRYAQMQDADDDSAEYVSCDVRESEDTATVMLPQQPSYFEEDSPQDPARIIHPHFSMNAGRDGQNGQNGAADGADGSDGASDRPDEPLQEPDTNTHHGKIVADDAESTDPSGDFAITPHE
ncbi:MAG: phosphotransferase [Bifidobacteriaceae bacterium]|nr:phosphotransferase [Bifidobacteriaceae bacterium]